MNDGKFSAFLFQVSSSGAHISWYAEDPSLEKVSNDGVAANGSMAGK